MANHFHIYPVNDTKEHYLESVDNYTVPPYCPCLCDPKKELQENGTWLIIHNSFDGREGLEWTKEILAI